MAPKGKRRSAGGIQIDMSLGLAQISKDVQTLQTSLERQFAQIQRGFQKAFSLGGVVVGVIGAQKAISGLMKSLTDLASEGDRVGDIRTQFAALGGSAAAIDKAKDAIYGVVSSTELMRIANIGLLRQLPEMRDNFDQIARYGNAISESLGGSATEGIERVTNALAKSTSKQLESIGLYIDQGKAYKDYADKVKIAAATAEEAEKKLSNTQKADARRAAAMAELTEQLKTLAEPGKDVTQAYEAWLVTIGDVRKELGLQINENTDLAEAWRDLSKVMDGIDWEGVGHAISAVTTNILNLTAEALPLLASWLQNIGNKLDYITQTSAIAKAAKLSIKIDDLKDQANKNAGGGATIDKNNPWSFKHEPVSDALSLDVNKSIAAEIAALEAEKTRIIKGEQDARAAAATAAAERERQGAERLSAAEAKRGALSVKGREEQSKGSEKLAKEMEREAQKLEALTEKWQAWLRATDQKQIENRLGLDIESQNFESFLAGLEQLQARIAEAVNADTKEMLEKGIATEDQLAKYRADKFAEVSDPMWDKYLERGKEIQDALAEHQKQRSEQAVEFWGDVFTNAITGVSFDVEDIFKRGLAGLAAQIAGAISDGAMTGINSLDDMGKGLGKVVLAGLGLGEDAAGSSGFAGISNAINRVFLGHDGSPFYGPGGDPSGSGMGQSNAPGVMSPAGGWATYAAAAFNISQAAMSMEEINKQQGSYAGTGGALGAGAGAAVGSYFLPGAGTMIGSTVGQVVGSLAGDLFGSGNNAGTAARHEFANWIEEQLAQLTTLAVRDASGNLNTLRGSGMNFLEGKNGFFNQEGWGDQLSSWEGNAGAAFSGLGNALKEVLGLTEEVGGQMGYLMGVQFGTDIDSARLLVAQLGLDFETLGQKLEEAALKGSIRWAEYNVQMAGLGEAFEPGLVAVGAYAQAMDDLVSSGGRGMAAVLAFKNIAVEAMEAGLTSIDELRARLIESGQTPEQVDAILQAAAQSGITTLEEWAASSNVQAGSIIGNMEAISTSLQAQWQDMSSRIEDLDNQLRGLPETITTTINIKVKDPNNALNTLEGAANGDTEGAAFARGGVVSGATFFKFGRGSLGLMGEDGAEAILPLKRINGKLGVSAQMSGGSGGGVVINVDARGAQNGVERDVFSAFDFMSDAVMNRAVKSISSRGAF